MTSPEKTHTLRLDADARLTEQLTDARAEWHHARGVLAGLERAHIIITGGERRSHIELTRAITAARAAVEDAYAAVDAIHRQRIGPWPVDPYPAPADTAKGGGEPAPVAGAMNERLVEIESRYLGQDIEEFIGNGGDPDEYAALVFKREIFGRSTDPRDPDLGINTEQDLADALKAMAASIPARSEL